MIVRRMLSIRGLVNYGLKLWITKKPLLVTVFNLPEKKAFHNRNILKIIGNNGQR